MTTKTFFVKTLKSEVPIFVRVLKAIPEGNSEYRPDPKSKTALELAAVIASEAGMTNDALRTGIMDLTKENMPRPPMNAEENAKVFEAGMAEVMNAAETLSEEAWEEDTATMIYPGGKWEEKKGQMAWSMLFDLIHHRGQLSTYLRAMGGKVPSIYGPSADSAPQA